MAPPTSSLWPRWFSPSYPARPSHVAPQALRGTPGGATIPIPGGAGTPWTTSCKQPRARRTGFYHRVGAPTLLPPRRYGAPVLRSGALPRPYALSPPPSRHLQRAHNTFRTASAVVAVLADRGAASPSRTTPRVRRETLQVVA